MRKEDSRSYPERRSRSPTCRTDGTPMKREQLPGSMDLLRRCTTVSKLVKVSPARHWRLFYPSRGGQLGLHASSWAAVASPFWLVAERCIECVSRKIARNTSHVVERNAAILLSYKRLLKYFECFL